MNSAATATTERHGLRWMVSPDVEKSEICLRDHEDWLEHYIPTNPFAVVVDVGAFVGTFAIPAARRAGRVIAFEPHGPSLRLLLENARLNGCDNVVALPFAVGDRRGVARLSGNGLTRRMAAADGSECIVTTLDHALRNEPRIDLVKIDVEGGEVDVLDGALLLLRRLRPTLIVEVHSHFSGCEHNGNRIEGVLHPFRYNCRRIWENSPSYFYLLCEPCPCT